MAPSPTLTWSAIPTCPASTTPRPSFEDPETPTWATRIECSPTSTLWPIWTRLSILVPRRTMVSPKVARSIVVLAPISTSSSMTTPPVCGILRWRAPSKANPKPSAPMTAPGCTSTRRPSRAPASSVTCGPSTQPSPTSTSGPTYVSAPTRAPDPMRAPASITASGPTAAVASTRASPATTALASTPGSSGRGGEQQEQIDHRRLRRGHRQDRRGQAGDVGTGDGGARARGLGGRAVAGVGEEGHVVGPGALQRPHAPHHPRGVTLEGGAQRLRELAESGLGSRDPRQYFFLPPASRS